MRHLLLLTIACLTFVGLSFGQTNVLDFETIQDPMMDPFDLKDYQYPVTNPSKTAPNTSDNVGKAVKALEGGNKWWGGTNIYLGGDIDLSGNDSLTIDYYAEQSGLSDTILFKIELSGDNRSAVALDAYYTDASNTDVNVWKTLTYVLPDTLTGSYNKLVIFFNWMNYVTDGDVFYFDNIVVPGFTAYTSSDVTFTITDKFNNASDVKLFIDGTEATLTQSSNVYSNTSTLTAYSILTGSSTGIYEIVYSHVANGEEVRDTTSLVCGSASGTQDLNHLIIVEEKEDGTALAISVGDTPPTIDGVVDNVWSNAKTHTMQERSWWGTPTGLYSKWKVMWDIDNIYLLYIVEDETAQNGNAVDVYKNDCVETFFDMNKSATTPYDADDFQIRTIRDLDTWTGSANVTDVWAANVSRGQVADASGYVVELAIPWTSLSSTFLPIDGADFNYDCTVADVTSAGGTRIFRESWTTAEDVAYMNTAHFGTITLTTDTQEGGTSTIENTDVSNLLVYPNPANDQLTISSDITISSVSLIDIAGRIVETASDINSTITHIDVKELSVGIYILNVIDENGHSSSQKLRIY